VVLSYLSRLLGVVRTVSGSPGLLRVELAFVGFNVAEWATWVSTGSHGCPAAPATPKPHHSAAEVAGCGLAARPFSNTLLIEVSELK
jgi:hypothetical protein